MRRDDTFSGWLKQHWYTLLAVFVAIVVQAAIVYADRQSFLDRMDSMEGVVDKHTVQIDDLKTVDSEQDKEIATLKANSAKDSDRLERIENKIDELIRVNSDK